MLIINNDKARRAEKVWTEYTQHGLLETWTAYDDGSLTCQTTHDMTAILEDNARLRSAGVGKSKTGEFVFRARIPLGIYNEYLKKGIDLLQSENEKHLRRLLNDSDYSKLRITEGVM